VGDGIDGMNRQLDSTLQETTTALPPDEVLRAAKRFFTRHNSIYAAFPEREGPTFVAMRGQGGEEVIIGVAPADGATRVTGSTYLFDQQVARFFATLPMVETPPPHAAAAPAGPPPAGPAPSSGASTVAPAAGAQAASSGGGA